MCTYFTRRLAYQKVDFPPWLYGSDGIQALFMMHIRHRQSIGRA